MNLDVMMRNTIMFPKAFPGAQWQMNVPANAGDVGLIPGLGRSLAEGSGACRRKTHSSVLAWESPWSKEPGGLQLMGSQNR